jgi:hypothetical protein
MIHGFRPEGVALGIGLMALGILWMLATVRRFWPLILVVWGALELGHTYLARRSR